ncbi:MAG: metal-dependent transcriptional regulator [Desulfobacteraceae bacterium]|nr:MAG: metal-dependent transcriptional regulator [Desulfobacteraceae bacterium]
MNSIQLSAQMEDYLEAIHLVCAEQGVARIKSIANKLRVSYPSVVGAIKSLKAKNLVQQEHYGYIRLTEEGREIAGAVSHRHEVLTRFLMDILDLDQETASNDACKLEHSVSPETVQRLRSMALFMEKDPEIHQDWRKEFRCFYSANENRERT